MVLLNSDYPKYSLTNVGQNYIIIANVGYGGNI